MGHNISHSPLPWLNWNCLLSHRVGWSLLVSVLYCRRFTRGATPVSAYVYYGLCYCVCLFLIQHIDNLIFLNQAYLLYSIFIIYIVVTRTEHSAYSDKCATTKSLEKPYACGSSIIDTLYVLRTLDVQVGDKMRSSHFKDRTITD